MSRRAQLMGSLVLVAATGGALAVFANDDTRRSEVRTPGGATSASCRPPAGTTPVVADPALARPAAVSVPGARSIETGGLAPDAVVEPVDAPPWVIVRDARAAQAPVGRVARIDLDTGKLGQLVEIVDGCDVTALTAAPSALSVGTCSRLGATTGAEVVELDPQTGALGRRVALPTGCVTTVASSDGYIWAASAARVDAPARIFRIDVASGAVDEPVTVAAGESLLGIKAGADAAWVSVQTSTGARLLRVVAATGAVVAVPTSGPSQVLGIVGTTLWTRDLTGSALVGRDATSGEVTQSVPVAGLATATAGTSGVWYQAATPDSLTVSIGRVDAAGNLTKLVSYTSTGPDRTGLPFLGTLSATQRGAWLATQDRLFLLAA